MKLKKYGLNLEGIFNWCSSLTGRFPKFVLFMIMSAVVEEVFCYNPICNLMEAKHFHRHVKTVVNRHNFHVERIDCFEWSYFLFHYSLH